jgi:hypothetical protein
MCRVKPLRGALPKCFTSIRALELELRAQPIPIKPIPKGFTWCKNDCRFFIYLIYLIVIISCDTQWVPSNVGQSLRYSVNNRWPRY